VQDVANVQHAALEGLDGAARVDRLCELNVVEQARHVCETTVIQDAWARGQTIAVHAWIYGLRDGRLRDLGFDSSNGLKERNHG
jgi:carbonic anhydrase